ncbi:Bax inhibitor-1/YccA family protein [Nonomuraea soli]|uniref:Putative YccA/Bax inhibitor family protein n=1 Tax=Nonomuraea soli TaxID=1032476 RepID=A0A7W0CQU3_9ACTN|nr:Bax inhibitor-1/YccA family protein [Nonomuraea soli]MBA2895602.1 putative YccA/Bax inhibitor family protein [Nonomuraea soli]
MESKNPIFSRSQYTHPGQYQTPTPGHLQNMYDAPAYQPPAPPAYRTMTIDDVVVKGFMTLGTLVLTGAAAWVLNVPMGVAIVFGLVGLVLGLIASFKQSTNPALILGYAACYGVFVGALSLAYENFFNGIVLQAVIGTALAFAGTLAVYSLRIVRVSNKMVKYVTAASIAVLGLMLVNLLVGIFVPGGFGLREAGPLGYVFSIAMILLGVFFLLLDFAAVEEGVRAGAPAKFAWQCAFGLTLSLVWIYLEVLRFISYFSSSD